MQEICGAVLIPSIKKGSVLALVIWNTLYDKLMTLALPANADDVAVVICPKRIDQSNQLFLIKINIGKVAITPKPYIR